MKNRYYFIKKIYKEYIIFILRKNKYYLLDNDLMICNIYDININNIDKYNINYLILDNLDIIKVKEFTLNKYSEYLFKAILINLLKKNNFSK